MLPSRDEALIILAEGEDINPGPWGRHSLHCARAAEAIATACGMNPEKAWILGLLHDIGRVGKSPYARHMVDGYAFCRKKNWEECARICLTHSYPSYYGDPAAGYIGKWDIASEDTQFLKRYLDSIQMDDYDRLIQMCDALALPEGFCLMEKRFVDVARRHGYSPASLEKWEAWLRLLDQFSARMGKSVYCVLPGVAETTFGLSKPEEKGNL